MKLKKVHSAVIASALTASMVITPVFADPTQQELEDQKANAQSELENLQTELDSLVQKMGDLEDELISGFDEYTGDIKVDYDIGDARDLTDSEIQSLESDYMGYLGDIEDAKEVEFSYEMYVDGELRDSGEDEQLTVIKLDGKWYLNPGDM